MKQYDVEVRVVTVQVQARNKEEAERKAEQLRCGAEGAHIAQAEFAEAYEQ